MWTSPAFHLEEYRRRNFVPTMADVPGPKGAVQQERMVQMTKDEMIKAFLTCAALVLLAPAALLAQPTEKDVEWWNQRQAERAPPPPAPAYRDRSDLSDRERRDYDRCIDAATDKPTEYGARVAAHQCRERFLRMEE